MKAIALLLSASVLAGCSLFGDRASYEAPDYQVVATLDEAVEIRRYQPRLAVEASVPAEDDENSAFRLLFAYITGANSGESEIAMTMPVEVAQEPAEIAMTVPVETAREEGGAMRMRFFLPTAYSLATAPKPTDPRVKLVEVPAEEAAVLRFSGLRNDSRVAGKTELLRQDLVDSGWRVAGEPVAYFYDPPWTLPPFRRNEVALPVVRAGD
ncbi:MAG: heme-binding protein [Rhodospirillales bacterium]